MAVIGPLRFEKPDVLSADTMVGVGGTVAGILGSEFVASSVISATRLAGDTALAAGGATKAGLGLGAWYGATKTTGLAKTGLYLVSMGSFASIGLDIVHRLFPRATAGLAAKLGAPRVYAAARYAPTLRAVPVAEVPVTAPPMITVKR